MTSKTIYQSNINMITIQSLYCIGGYVTYEISVSTAGFSGMCSFCIAENIVQDYVGFIEIMVNSLCGEVKVCDCESDAYLRFFFKDTMNFYVLGQIGGSHEDNILRFKLKADQTLLLGLKEKLLDY